jgi:hypothetical protein
MREWHYEKKMALLLALRISYLHKVLLISVHEATSYDLQREGDGMSGVSG